MTANATLPISVVMCTYNGAAYLRQQLDSVLAQTYPIEEIIVQDDGSTDATPDILQDYATRDARIRVYANEGPHGINANFFSAMRRARSTYIALSDQDDIWEPHKLERQAAAIGSCLLCSCGSVPFADGFPVSNDHRRPNYHILRVAYLGALPGHTFLMHRSLTDYLPDGAQCPFLYDWQLQLAAAAAESIAYVDETLVHFRRHAGAATATAPVSARRASLSTLHYIWTTLVHHKALQRHIRERFLVIMGMLGQWPFNTHAQALCREMAVLQTAHGPRALLRRMAFFVRHQEHLFYAEERRSFFLTLRALYYPFACGYVYRARLARK